MKIRKYVAEGEMIPAFYGVAWKDYACRRLVAYPIPLHFIMCLFRSIWFRIMFLDKNWVNIHDDKVDHEAWTRGYKSGKDSIGMNEILAWLERHPHHLKIFKDALK